ncbi:bacteriocin [Enterococcus faecium]|uniref:bacteriocin n=1 Tax=Enterococcus faecium TaxID=1352 RepID=UPI00248EDE80|nr:bacteriocin [Enterococcus faecium]MDT6458597.1 bacteriocin [Enterococcus faecium]
MQNVKELSTKEMKQIIGGENDHRMPNELIRPNNLSKGGAKCGAAIAGGLFGIPKGPLAWAAGLANVYSKCN